MNEAFIDSQNLIFGTKQAKQPWNIDLSRFLVYLKNKYNVQKAYYFIGYFDDKHRELYEYISKCGYILVFREHNQKMNSMKKGNVDTDIVFEVMKKLADDTLTGKIIVVSGDGDYYKMINYLISKNKFKKLLAPEECRMSSLYKQLNPKYYAFLNRKEVKRKVGKKNAGPA